MRILLLLLFLTLCQSSEFMDILTPLVKPPLHLRQFSMGKTINSKPLLVYILTMTNFTEISQLYGRQTILLDSYMHSRQPYSLQLMQQMATSIITQANNAIMQQFLTKGVIIFYPFVNPDGYQVFTESRNIDVRKNRNIQNMNCVSGLPGVDINRNFPSNFGILKESSDPCSQQYHGKSPFSQSQSQVFQQLFTHFHIIIAIDIHSYGNEWIYPYASDLTGNRVKQHFLYPFYRQIKDQFSERGRKVRSCIQSLGYIADGVYIDWALDQGALSFAFQVGKTFRSDKQNDIAKDIQLAIEDFFLIVERTLPKYQVKRNKNFVKIVSKSLTKMKISVQVGNKIEEKVLKAGQTLKVEITLNDTLATIKNHENGQKQVIYITQSYVIPLNSTIVIAIIVILLFGLLLIIYLRYKKLNKKYAHISTETSLSQIQELPTISSSIQ